MVEQSITINSINYDGEEAQVVFTPDNDPVTINLGTVTKLLPSMELVDHRMQKN